MSDTIKSLIISLKWPQVPYLSLNEILEVFGASLFMFVVFFLELICAYIVYLMIAYGGLITHLALGAYISFIFIDREADQNCSRQGSKWFRDVSVWKYFAKYFPVKLIKTAELPANTNYILACFPHGVIGCGYFCNFVTNGTNFYDLFPGIRSRVASITYHFYVPFYREIALSWGAMSVKYVSIKNALSQSNNSNDPANKDGLTSNAVVISVGGAQESMYSKPGCYRILLKKRKGFVKLALETGSPLVPVFSFGEVDVFDQITGIRPLEMFQNFFKRLTGFSPIYFVGRGFCQYSLGGLPHRCPINTVVGAPISVSKYSNPSQSDIDNLHRRFTEELEKLFEEHKWKYLKNPKDVKLIIE